MTITPTPERQAWIDGHAARGEYASRGAAACSLRGELRMLSDRHGRRSIVIACALMSVTIAAGSAAAARSHHAAQAPQIMTMKGTCEKFRVGAHDDAEHCKGLFVQTVNNGFVDFTFTTSTDAMMTFSGRGEQVTPDSNTALQPVDRVLFMYKSQKDTMQAVGSCRYTNPYAGAATVECTAEVDGGKIYSAHFTSDGKVPDKLTP